MLRRSIVFIVPAIFLLPVFFPKTLPASKNEGQDGPAHVTFHNFHSKGWSGLHRDGSACLSCTALHPEPAEGSAERQTCLSIYELKNDGTETHIQAKVPSVKSFRPNQLCATKPPKKEVVLNTRKLRIPFIANKGQMNERVAFYANTFGGSIFVTKAGEIVYSLPGMDKRQETRVSGRGSEVVEMGYEPPVMCNVVQLKYQLLDLFLILCGDPISKVISSHSVDSNPHSEICIPQSEIKSVVLKEELVGAQVKAVLGGQPSVTKVNYFKGSNLSGWKTNIPTYEFVMLGEVYKGIDLRLKAYGNNMEKIFCIKPGANADQIKIRLSGIQPHENPPPAFAGAGQPSVPFREGDKGGGLTAKSSLGDVMNAQSKEKGRRQTASKSHSEEGVWQTAPISPLIKGTGRLLVNEYGELEVETGLGIVKFTKPVAYQEIDGKRVEVGVEYDIQSSGVSGQKSVIGSEKSDRSNPKSSVRNCSTERSRRNPKSEYGFKVAAYDRTKELIIDPLLASTFLGGSGDEVVQSVAIDPDGNVYITGNTSSSNFPTTTGSYDVALNGDQDVFISKLDEDLTSLLASSYLGGSSTESGFSVTLDSGGNVYIAGQTSSSDFPTTDGAYDTSLSGGLLGDAFVSKLNGDLTDLLASTYLGGSRIDYAYPAAIDADGNIYVTGMTTSSDFPTTGNAYGTSHNGLQDVFVSKFGGDLSSLLASTFLGGSFIEFAYSTALDPDGAIYVVGQTASSDFPVTKGAYDKSLGGGALYGDAFVSRLSEDLTNLLASTFLGGSFVEFAYDIAIDKGGNVYVSGATSSENFPATRGAYKKSLKGGIDAFVTSFKKDLTGIRASTYLGGTSDDYGYSLLIGPGKKIYLSGYTLSSDFPTTRRAYDTSANGDVDVFVARLKGNLRKLVSSTYLGGFGKDYCYSTAMDSEGNISVAGYTQSSNFPKTNGTSYNGGNDAFVSKFDGDLFASNTSGGNSKISGHVADNGGVPLEDVKIKAKGLATGTKVGTVTDAEGFFVFEDLKADTYNISAKKRGYKKGEKEVPLGDGDEEDVIILLQKK